MSQAIVYGFTPNELKPGPDFAAGSDSSGKWTGSQTFTCRKFDFSGDVIQQLLRRGTKVTTVYPNLGNEWDFLTIADAKHEHQPGGITKIFVTYEGLASESFEYGDDGLELSYGMAGTLADISIFKNPKLIAELSQNEILAIKGLLDGTARRRSMGSMAIVSNYDGRLIEDLTTAEALEWYDLIIVQGYTTYQASAVEWTKTSNTREGVTDEDLSSLGYIDTPEGFPPTFTDRNWRLTSATQNDSKSGSATVKTWSKSWTLSPQGSTWPAKIYTKP